MASYLGVPLLADDLAQHASLYYLENPDSRQSVDQSIVDAIRRLYGCPKKNKFVHKLRIATNLRSVKKLPDPRQNRAALVDLLEGFDLVHRVTLVMMGVYQVSQEELGFVLGVGPTATRNRIREAREKLRERIQS